MLRTLLCRFLFFALLPPVAAAQGYDRETRPASHPDLGVFRSYIEPMESGFSVRVGTGASVVRDYEGASGGRTVPVLQFDIETATPWGRVMAGTGGLVWLPVDRSGFRAGLTASYDWGRRDRDSNLWQPGSSYLEGMDDIGGAAEAGVLAIWALRSVAATLYARHALGGRGHGGMVAEASAIVPFHRGRSLQILVQPRVVWADSDYNQSWFGVTLEQAERSGLQPYQLTSSGLKSMQMDWIGLYELSPSWTLNARISQRRLLDGAADSPVVQRRSSTDFALFVVHRWGSAR